MKRAAYFFAGESEAGIAQALRFAESEFQLHASKTGGTNPDIITLRHALFSVEDARKVSELAQLTSAGGGWKLIVVSAGRMFHEAQNALLKLFEEPPGKTVLVLIVGSAGQLLPTLRSRLLPLPTEKTHRESRIIYDTDSVRRISSSFVSGIRGFADTNGLTTNGLTKFTIGEEFLNAGETERKKIVENILLRAKSDKDEEKQVARLDALSLAEGLERSVHPKWRETGKMENKEWRIKNGEYTKLLEDLERFIPILHERSAPLKSILEHLLIVLPQNPQKPPK